MLIEALLRDARHGLRSVARVPALSAVIVLSLAVAVGVNTTVFSWIQLFVFDPLPGVRGAGAFQLVEPKAETGSHPGASWPEYRDLRERLTAFEDLLAFRMLPVNVGEMNRTERTYAQLVSGNFFDALGQRPALGRFFRPDEASRPGGEPVAVVSHDYWQSRMGGAPDVIGTTLRVNNREIAVIGVAAEGFQGTVLGLQFDLWMPATLAPTLLPGSLELDDRGSRGYSVLGRLKAGATRAQADGELDAAMRDLAIAFPQTNRTMTGEVLPFWRSPRGPQGMFLEALIVLQAIMLLLLLAVCANTANLLLARGSARQREIGVRLAIGASRWRVIRLLMIESALLALAGAALGALLAMWGTQALRNVPLSTAFPVRFQTSVDWMGLAFTAILAVASTVAFGAAPAAQCSRLDPASALRRGAAAGGRHRLRNVLMGAEVALALAVLVVAGLFLQSFRETRELDPGFTREGILLATYDITGRSVPEEEAREFARRLLEKLAAAPGVSHVALSASVPLDIHGMPLRSFAVEGNARTDGTLDRALYNTVTPDYFAAMGIPLLAGAGFAGLGDTTQPPQAVVNEEFVRRYVAGLEPLGRRIETRGRAYVISGVVKNSTYDSFGEEPKPLVYFSYRDRPLAMGEVHLRTRAGTETLLAPRVREAVRELNPALPVYNVRTMAEHIETNLFLRRIPARMFAVLGPLLLVLAAIGIYAVVAYSVSQRTTEIGVRLALGATPQRVVLQILRQSFTVIAAGAALGWVAVWIVNAHINRNAPLDPVAFIVVPGILLAVAAFACWIPARCAASADPMTALRIDH